MTTPTKPKRKPDSALPDDDDDDDDDAFGIYPKRPRTVKDLPHARASPGAGGEKFVERQTADDQTLGGFDPDRGPRTQPGPDAERRAVACGSNAARKPRAKPTPTPKKSAPPTPKKPKKSAPDA